MENCYVAVSVNGAFMLNNAAVPGEDKGRTTHQLELLRQQIGPENTVSVMYQRGSSVLFLGYCEIELIGPQM